MKKSVVLLVALSLLSMNAASVSAEQASSIAPPNKFISAMETDDSLLLVWDKVKGADSYKVYLDNKTLIYKGEASRFVHQGLSSDTSYEYYLYSVGENETSNDYIYAWGHTKKETAHNKKEKVKKNKRHKKTSGKKVAEQKKPQKSESAEKKKGVVKLPAPPSNFKAATISHSSITLTWDKAEHAASYKIYLNNDELVYEGDVTTFHHMNLKDDQDYEYYIYSVNSKGVSSDYQYAWGYTPYLEKDKPQVTTPPPGLKDKPVEKPPTNAPAPPILPEVEPTIPESPKKDEAAPVIIPAPKEPPLSTPAPPTEQKAPAGIKSKLSQVEDYKYYLDSGSKEILEKMKTQDLVIIEPVVMDQKYIDETQKSGTLVYGYINSMEADNWNTDLMKRFKEEAFFHDAQGKRHYISLWDAYLMDISNKHYQDVLLDEIERQVVNKGLDGVFLDTVGSIEDYHYDNPVVMKEQQQGMKAFMKRIKERFPNLSIAQNWGFDTLADYTAPYVDFVMWEQFDYSKITSGQWGQDTIQQLKAVRAKHGTEVFTVSFTQQHESARLAESHGFKNLYNAAGSYYNTW